MARKMALLAGRELAAVVGLMMLAFRVYFRLFTNIIVTTTTGIASNGAIIIKHISRADFDPVSCLGHIFIFLPAILYARSAFHDHLVTIWDIISLHYRGSVCGSLARLRDRLAAGAAVAVSDTFLRGFAYWVGHWDRFIGHSNAIGWDFIRIPRGAADP